MNFEACLSLPHDPREAGLIADNLDALARALREWPAEAWERLLTDEKPQGQGLFERLAARTAPAALDKGQKAAATRSAEAVADVLRVLWPEARPTTDSTRYAAAPERILSAT